MTGPNQPAAIDLAATFAGRKVLLLGGTGFLGKVMLSMLLDRFPGIGRIYLMVRASSKAESESRFWESIVPSPALKPLRDRHGDALNEFLREKIVVVTGDITSENLGFTEEEASQIAGDIDVVLNSSGRVTFNPPLEAALKTNVNGTENTISFSKRMKRPALVHVSTCFVAGNRSGEVWESEPVIGYFPRKGVEASDFSVDKEIDDCERLAVRVKDESRDKSLADRFRETARKRFLEEGRDTGDDRAMSLAIARERKNWIRSRLTDLGIQKSKDWGWPNIYTYTKSLGEQLVAAEEGIFRAIVRPSIVESALSFPFPGWNEGFTTTAPLVRMAVRGQNLFPVKTNVILDVIPVDMVASATLAVTAQTIIEPPELVYQVASGDTNPSRLGRLVDLLGLYKRKHFLDKPQSRWIHKIAARMEAQAVEPERFEKVSMPILRKATKSVANALDRVQQSQIGPLASFVGQAKGVVKRFEQFTSEGEEHYKTFKPFIVDNNYVFRTDHTRALFDRIDKSGDPGLRFAPGEIDWYDYWLNVHLPGLKKWVFPRFEEVESAKPRRVYTYKQLLELFEACTKNYAGHIAMRIERDGREERYTYSDLRECALRAAAFLRGKGVEEGARIALFSDNAPEWGMAYFGIVRTGAAVIPLERDASADDVARLCKLGQAKALIVSPELFERHSGLRESLPDEVAIWTFDEVFALTAESTEQKRISELPKTVSPGAVASIIFTSGTTGNPKGVMLTHRNFASLLAKLASVYDLDTRDGMLSVLPLHHSFEFTTGFLLPLSRGAQITYLGEITGETISRELDKGHVTCIVGVPALWDLLKRRVLSRISDRSSRLGDLVEALIDANYLLRDETPLNFGPLVFLPIHAGFGGRIRYLISGGSALSESTLKTFRGLGFNLNEGYGLTEASPVLTVTRPEGKVVPGSVGRPLPGVEIRIHEPDHKGVGEVIARGPNVMAGYYGNEAATSETIRDGWLFTGDLGRLDEGGNLYIVGRSKELIVDRNGKNVYPDELEELYAEPGLIEELAVIGLPDGSGEQVAAVVVPKLDVGADAEARIREHFHSVSSKLPLYKRVKTLEIRDEKLPRTATRKVKRRELTTWLEERREIAPDPQAGESDQEWLLELVERVSEKPRSAISLDAGLDELGFDSLMYSELAGAIESRTGESLSADVLMSLTSLRELTDSLRLPGGHGGALVVQTPEKTKTKVDLPPFVQTLGREGLGAFQRWFYLHAMHPVFHGRANIPEHSHFLVVANHSSHLDMGLAKMALGKYGQDLVALAAADYFFDNKVKRTLFENFTNLVPMERKGSLRKSLEWAFHLLEQGYNVLIFPEGTRSRDGVMKPFQRGIGHLVLRAKVGILPLHLSTYGALPPGTWYPQSRELSARIGTFLPYETLERLSRGLRRSDAERAVAALAQRLVEHERDGTRADVESDLADIRARYETPARNPQPVRMIDSET